MLQKNPRHRESQPTSCSDAEWLKHYVNNPCRDWTCADLEKFIGSCSKEPKARARKQLAFRKQHGLV